MKTPLKIEICMGSSCFLRGNRENLELIQEYIRKHGIEAEVVLKGALCHGQCSRGPIIRFDGQTYSNVDGPTAVDILKTCMEREENEQA